MEQEIKELKLKLKVLEKLVLMGITEKDLSHFGAPDFWEIYRNNKLTDREGDMLLGLAEAIGKKQLYSFLEVKKTDEKREMTANIAPSKINGGDSVE